MSHRRKLRHVLDEIGIPLIAMAVAVILAIVVIAITYIYRHNTATWPWEDLAAPDTQSNVQNNSTEAAAASAERSIERLHEVVDAQTASVLKYVDFWNEFCSTFWDIHGVSYSEYSQDNGESVGTYTQAAQQLYGELADEYKLPSWGDAIGTCVSA